MQRLLKNSTRAGKLGLYATAVAVSFALGTLSGARADEAEAKGLLKAMSDYLAAQKSISLDYDTSLEIVTTDHQKVALASSGTVALQRPDKVRVTRTGGFADVELNFDGKTLTFMGKNANAYTQVDAPGKIDHLVDEIRNKYHRPVPGADLLLSDVYDELMASVVNVKDLGSGVIRGMECNHLAFRTEEVDWQIWIAQGDRPYPCRYVITSKMIPEQPEYTLDIRAWKAGHEVAAEDFGFKAPAQAKKLDLDQLSDFDELPNRFATGGAK